MFLLYWLDHLKTHVSKARGISLGRRLLRPSMSGRSRRKRLAREPRSWSIESLEDRTLLTSFTFENVLETPLPIPETGTQGTTQSTLTITDSLLIDDLNFLFNIDHTFDFDLIGTLTSPEGTSVVLFDSVGGDGQNFLDTKLNDEASTPIENGSAPFAGSFQPTGNLSDFDGQDTQGVWTFTIEDQLFGDSGFLNSWSLEVEPALRIFTSADTPLAIPDAFELPGTVQSTITVLDSFNIDDLDVRFDALHTFDSDLDVFLTGPDGTQIVLFRGVGGDGQDFNNTILDDEAAISIDAGNAPFAGSFRPIGSLSAYDGLTAQGDWTLTITDNFLGDSGTLKEWELIFRQAFDTGEIRGQKFNDLNGNGVLDEGERGLEQGRNSRLSPPIGVFRVSIR